MAGKDPRLARIRWGCRRGMLELDVIFEPFFDHCFESLEDDQQAIFERLLSCDDPELFTWVMGHGQSSDPELASMIQRIVNFNNNLVR